MDDGCSFRKAHFVHNWRIHHSLTARQTTPWPWCRPWGSCALAGCSQSFALSIFEFVFSPYPQSKNWPRHLLRSDQCLGRVTSSVTLCGVIGHQDRLVQPLHCSGYQSGEHSSVECTETLPDYHLRLVLMPALLDPLQRLLCVLSPGSDKDDGRADSRTTQ